MLFHLGILVAIVLLYFLTHISKKDRRTQDRIFLFIVFTAIFLIMALRDETMGNDTITYLDLFSECARKKWSVNILNNYFEPGYILFNILLSYISPSRRFFLIAVSLLLNTATYKLIKDNSKNYLMSTLMFVLLMFFYASMAATRQYIAISLILLAIPYAKNRNILKYFLIVAIASLIHTTAFLGIAIYIYYRVKYNRKAITILAVSTVLATFFIGPLYDSFMSLVQRNAYHIGRIGNLSIITIVYFIMYLSFYLLMLYLAKKKNIQNSDNNQVYIYSAATAASINLVGTQMNILSRADDYFGPMIIIGLPNMIEESIAAQKKKLLYYLVIIFTLTIFSSSIIMLRPEWNTAYRYMPCFSNQSVSGCSK